MVTMDFIIEKQQRFNAAMVKYENGIWYLWVGHAVSFVNVTLQISLGALAFGKSITIIEQVLAVTAAYILADFANGLVHTYMDNNDNYQSLVSPLVASFHLHHRTPQYKQKPLIAVYYHETGSKIWLIFYMVIAVMLISNAMVINTIAYALMYFAFFFFFGGSVALPLPCTD